MNGCRVEVTAVAVKNWGFSCLKWLSMGFLGSNGLHKSAPLKKRNRSMSDWSFAEMWQAVWRAVWRYKYWKRQISFEAGLERDRQTCQDAACSGSVRLKRALDMRRRITLPLNQNFGDNFDLFSGHLFIDMCFPVNENVVRRTLSSINDWTRMTPRMIFKHSQITVHFTNQTVVVLGVSDGPFCDSSACHSFFGVTRHVATVNISICTRNLSQDCRHRASMFCQPHAARSNVSKSKWCLENRRFSRS